MVIPTEVYVLSKNIERCLEKIKEVYNDFAVNTYKLSQEFAEDTLKRIALVAEYNDGVLKGENESEGLCVVHLMNQTADALAKEECREFVKNSGKNNYYIADEKSIRVIMYMFNKMLVHDCNNGIYFCGASDWDSLDSFFRIIKEAPIKYCVLRNSAFLPYDFWGNDHDIDLLCDNRFYFVSIANAFSRADGISSYALRVEGKGIPVDVRFLGDDYYYFSWECDMLNSAYCNEKGISVLPEEEYIFSLLYHALIQKKDFPQKYMNDLETFFGFRFNLETYCNVLVRYMRDKEYFFVIPRDYSIECNDRYVRLPFYKEIRGQRGRKQLIREVMEDIVKIVRLTFPFLKKGNKSRKDI